jgi:hypothetical protein
MLGGRERRRLPTAPVLPAEAIVVILVTARREVVEMEQISAAPLSRLAVYIASVDLAVSYQAVRRD